MKRQILGVILVALMIATVASNTRAAAVFSYVSQSRSVSASATETDHVNPPNNLTRTQSLSQSAPDFNGFNPTVTAHVEDPNHSTTDFATASASQNSTLDPNQITVSGQVSASAFDDLSTIMANSGFQVSFTLSSSTPVDLSGVLSASAAFSSFATASVQLQGNGQTLASFVVFAGFNNPAKQPSQTLPFDQFFVLGPGTYTLIASAPLPNVDINSSAQASFQFNLNAQSVPLPKASSTTLATLAGLALMGLGRFLLFKRGIALD